jgi:hypothetical protein
MTIFERLGQNSIVTQMPDLIATDLDNNKVMMNLNSGKYYILDGIASRIWQLLETSPQISDIVDILIQEYNIEYEQCLADLLRFFTKMVQAGLVAIASNQIFRDQE